MSETVKRKRKPKFFFDYTILFAVVFLLLFGLVMLYSTSSYSANLENGDPLFYVKKQVFATVIGVAVMFFVMFIDYRKITIFAWIGYAVSLGLILLVLSPLGITVNGARRWLNLGLSLQPAEVAKAALIVFFASMVCNLGNRLNDNKEFIKVIALALPHAGAILFITKNLSSAIIVMCIVLGMLFVATPRVKEYIIAAIIGIVGVTIVVLLVKYDVLPSDLSFRLNRIKAWLDPTADASKTGFQTLQALYAIGAGDMFGKGLGESMQKLGYLPEAQNDMIFSIICEELGLFGAIAILFLFAVLTWRFYVVASNAVDLFGALLVVGVMCHVSIQVILNIAVVTNTIPNTGISLPFISYGGSSVVFLLAEMGLVLSVSRKIRVDE